MAITVTTGSAANSASAASLALPSFNLTAGQDVVVAVSLGSTSSSVTSITDTKGNTYTQKSAVNGSGIRTEIWASHAVGVQVGNIITINVSPNTTIAGAAEEYAGVSSYGNTGTGSGTDQHMQGSAATQDKSNFVLCAMGFVAQSGDTLTAVIGTSRQSSIPAATRVGIALYDNTMITQGTIRDYARISTARNWAVATVELRSGSGNQTPGNESGSTVAALQVAKDIRYISAPEPLFAGGVTGQIVAATRSGADTIYTFGIGQPTGLSLPATITITNMDDAGNNGTFAVKSINGNQVTVGNDQGVTKDKQNGKGNSGRPSRHSSYGITQARASLGASASLSFRNSAAFVQTRGTISSPGKLIFSSTAALHQTESLAASSKLIFSSTAALTQSAAQLAASALLVLTGTSDLTQALAALNASGSVATAGAITGAADFTQSASSLDASALLKFIGQAQLTQATAELAASGKLIFASSAALSQLAEIDASALLEFTSTATFEQAAAVLSATATNGVAGQIFATGDFTQSSGSISATGSLRSPQQSTGSGRIRRRHPVFEYTPEKLGLTAKASFKQQRASFAAFGAIQSRESVLPAWLRGSAGLSQNPGMLAAQGEMIDIELEQFTALLSAL